jgi:RNA polymerase sigma factor (sigma-70 family)
MFSRDFEEFVLMAEPRLRRALIARWGPDTGREATAQALVYAWKKWDLIREMANPVGYLFRVGETSIRRRKRAPNLAERPNPDPPRIEPALKPLLESLSRNQRVAVILHHGFSWTYDEVGELLGISKSSVRNHIRRGMEKLRSGLGVAIDG